MAGKESFTDQFKILTTSITERFKAKMSSLAMHDIFKRQQISNEPQKQIGKVSIIMDNTQRIIVRLLRFLSSNQTSVAAMSCLLQYAKLNCPQRLEKTMVLKGLNFTCLMNPFLTGGFILKVTVECVSFLRSFFWPS